VRGSAVIGGDVAAALIAVFGVTVIGVFVCSIRAAAGTAPRPKSPEGKRIERGVTIATVLEFAAAIVPTGCCRRSVSRPLCCGSTTESMSLGTGRSGGAPTNGPVIFVATMSGTPLIATTGIAAGLLLLGTAVAGFRDLAGVRRAAQHADVSEVAFSAGAQL
jgi:hypothetical protein